MSESEIREFNLGHELDKLTKMYLLPITNVIYDEPYEYGKCFFDAQMDHVEFDARLYVNDDFIGSIPYIMTGKWGPGYLQCNHEELAWDKVFLQFKQFFWDETVKKQPLAASIEVREHRQFNVKDKDGIVIDVACCTYVADKWNIVSSGSDPVRVVLASTVTIKAPPSNN